MVSVVVPEGAPVIVTKLSWELIREGSEAVAEASAGAEIVYPSITLSVVAVDNFHE